MQLIVLMLCAWSWWVCLVMCAGLWFSEM